MRSSHLLLLPLLKSARFCLLRIDQVTLGRRRVCRINVTKRHATLPTNPLLEQGRIYRPPLLGLAEGRPPLSEHITSPPEKNNHTGRRLARARR
jgi:hypothetical protein